jgi:DNA polymerase-3 subunit epsilon
MTVYLKDLEILTLDCQTTGANPDRGHLLEIGWLKIRASSLEKKTADPRPQAHLVKLPDVVEIPRTVERITGISSEDLKTATAPNKIWNKLVQVSQDAAARNPNSQCPAVIHFARFEEPFLRDLHQKYQPHDPFPLRVICTHEIARRLLPDLPRRGLRAIAGYFGHAMPELKRSADHALATAVIWKNLIALLNREANILTLNQLLKWMESSAPAARSQRSYPMDDQIRRNLPDQPGVYRMLRANGDVLYIGKAKSLKKRVNGYFRQTGSPGEHILEMLTQAYKLDYTVTGSALEAALLETDQIKHHSPPYNIALRRGRRELVFGSRDFNDFSRQTDKAHPIGPLPAGNLNTAMKSFATLIEAQDSRDSQQEMDIAHTLMGIPSEYAAEQDCLQAGIEVFRLRHLNAMHRRHHDELDEGHPFRILTALGAQFWREHLERQEVDAALEEVDPEESESTQDENGQHVWTPEDVCCVIEGVIRRAAHLIRRSRWFCILSEASLVWTSPAAGDHHRILLGLKKGAVAHRADLKLDQRIPVPPNYAIPTGRRKQNIDLMTYDRLRVLTTELRRLIIENRNVELGLRPRVTLRNTELKKVLRWV